MTNSELKDNCIKMLENILGNANPIAANQCLVDDYVETLKKIPKEDITVEFSEELCSKIQNAKDEKGFYWLNDVELLTKTVTQYFE